MKWYCQNAFYFGQSLGRISVNTYNSRFFWCKYAKIRHISKYEYVQPKYHLQYGLLYSYGTLRGPDYKLTYIRTSRTIKICRIILSRIFVFNKKVFCRNYAQIQSYSYLRIRLNTFKNVYYVFIRKYNHI